MTALTVTAADVRPLVGARIRRFDAGGSLNIGDVVYVAADGDVEQTSGTAFAMAGAVGIAVSTPDGGSSVTTGERVDVVTDGPVAGFSSLTPGALGWVSDTAGKVDSAAGTKDTVVGFAEAANIFHVRIQIVDMS
jgi:hypothetical protein